MNISKLDTVLFIYAKEGKAVVLNSELAFNIGKQMLDDNWVHTATIDPLLFINNLLSLKDEEVIKELNLLKGIK